MVRDSKKLVALEAIGRINFIQSLWNECCHALGDIFIEYHGLALN